MKLSPYYWKFTFLAIILLAGCSSANSLPPEPTPTSTLTPSLTPAPTSTPPPTATITLTPTPSFQVCSPLADLTLNDLTSSDVLKNTLKTPHPGMDDGHQGVDFAYWSRGPHKTMLGLPIYAAISGRVAVILKDRYPYGNAVIIETPLEQLPAAWLDKMILPTPAPVAAPSTRLTCPTPEVAPIWDQNHQSLYLLYAHMDQLPQVKVGDQVICGQQIGVVGTTGYSSNPHLHFETRIGPSGAIFDSMAHYITDASSEEMSNYCTWRISGIFAMFDPMKLLENQP